MIAIFCLTVCLPNDCVFFMSDGPVLANQTIIILVRSRYLYQASWFSSAFMHLTDCRQLIAWRTVWIYEKNGLQYTYLTNNYYNNYYSMMTSPQDASDFNHKLFVLRRSVDSKSSFRRIYWLHTRHSLINQSINVTQFEASSGQLQSVK